MKFILLLVMMIGRFFYSNFLLVPSVATFGQVPLLEVNGKYLAQTQSICRYLARKLKLDGANEWEAAKCDEIVDGIQDFALRKFNNEFPKFISFIYTIHFLITQYLVRLGSNRIPKRKR